MSGLWLDNKDCSCPDATVHRAGVVTVDGVTYCKYCRARYRGEPPAVTPVHSMNPDGLSGPRSGVAGVGLDVVICGYCQAQSNINSLAHSWFCQNCGSQSLIARCPACGVSQARLSLSRHATGRAPWMCHTCQTKIPLTPAKQKPSLGTAEGLSRSQKWLGAHGPNARLISESTAYEVQGVALVPNIRTWIGLSEDDITFTQGWGGGVAEQIRLSISDISSLTVGGAGSFVTSQPGGVFAIGSGVDGLVEAVGISALANSLIGIASTQQQRETLITITLPRRAIALVNRSAEPVALTTWFAPLQRRTAEQPGTGQQPAPTAQAAHHVERFEAIRLLRDSGAITEDEYQVKRARLLDDI